MLCASRSNATYALVKALLKAGASQNMRLKVDRLGVWIAGGPTPAEARCCALVQRLRECAPTPRSYSLDMITLADLAAFFVGPTHEWRIAHALLKCDATRKLLSTIHNPTNQPANSALLRAHIHRLLRRGRMIPQFCSLSKMRMPTPKAPAAMCSIVSSWFLDYCVNRLNRIASVG